MSHVRELTNQSRAYLCQFFDRLGHPYIPSVTTFVLTPVEKNAQLLADAVFGASNIKISPRQYFGTEYLRISMGTMEQMEKLTQTLSYVL